MPFLPISKQDMKDRGIDQLDFICITGDAYVDHPSFGIAIISRMLESCGCNVGIIAQPVTDEDFKKLGEPKYCFLVTGGNIDSMVSNYTVFKKKRWDDAYSEGGKGGKRPDRAVTVYCKTLTRLFPDKEIAIGGLEASLRRFAHYDYWADKVMPSILVDSGAKLLMYGMGELTIVQLYRELAEGKKLSEIHDIRGTCYLTEPKNTPLGAVQCDSFEIVSENKKAYAKSCRQQYDEQDEVYGKTMVQRHGNMMLVQNPPQRSLTQSEFDKAYELPYMKAYHPCYEKGGGVPGIKEVEFSITHNRGCFGYCNFCSIALHQGRRIQTRSEESVINEAIDLTKKPGFKGYIHDVGGPTANFRRTSCDKQEKAGLCKGKKCLAPEPCPALKVDHSEYLDMLRKIRSIKNVKRVFIRSGIRYDYMMKDKNDEFFKELVEHHVSGQLKVAPEHASNKVLDLMGIENAAVVEDVSNRGGGNPINLEQLYRFDPDVILFTAGSIYSTAADDAAWQPLRAITDGRYYEIPSLPYNWLSNPPSLNMLLGVWWLGNLLYPQYYDYDMLEKTQEMFKLFWDYDLSEDAAREMLAHSTLKDAQ